ncbi:polyprotein [Plakobranchus ocellatus]|uniref:Polyprotein n=1 Tax=Plakobranchus ocellatus TaxID=259542 RepID=A0AAV4C674_9GAST|nr:polyprotein [Plakobranchus ocellatus]
MAWGPTRANRCCYVQPQIKAETPLKSIIEEYRCGKARLMTMLEDLEDPAVRSIQPQLRTGRKWKVDKTVNQAKEGLKMKEVIGLALTGRKGLGSEGVKWWSKAEGKEKRDMIIDEIRLEANMPTAIPTRTLDKLGKRITKIYHME